MTMGLLKKALTILERTSAGDGVFSGEYCLSMRLEVGNYQVPGPPYCTVMQQSDGELFLEVAHFFC